MIQSALIYQTNIRRRIVAAIFDYGIIYGFTLAYLIHYGTIDAEGKYTVSGLKAFPTMLIWFVFTIGLEQLLGATIGNGIMGLKVVKEDAINKPTIIQSLKRHLLDVPDMLFFGLIAIVLIKNTPKKQRLGDIVAKTLVIRDR